MSNNCSVDSGRGNRNEIEQYNYGLCLSVTSGILDDILNASKAFGAILGLKFKEARIDIHLFGVDCKWSGFLCESTFFIVEQTGAD